VGKVLVTGATGYTGGHLCRRLIQENYQVVAFVRKRSRVEDLESIGVECRRVDIKDPTSVQDNFNGIDRVYHIAAAYRTEHSDHQEFWQVNVEATRNLLEAAKASKVKRFIHCSTVGVQGSSGRRRIPVGTWRSLSKFENGRRTLGPKVFLCRITWCGSPASGDPWAWRYPIPKAL
jgi:nucleoside-diphosphate-sugar epimerase